MSSPNPPTAPRVLVTGVGGPSGVAACVALKERGFTVYAADMNEVALPGVDRFHRVPPARDARFIPVIRELLGAHSIRWFFSTVQEELPIVAEHALALRAQGIATYISRPEVVRVCDDKWLTAEALRQADVPTPASAIGDPDAAPVRALGFPVLSKPRIGRGGRGVTVHDAPGVAPSPNAVWQEFLPGTDYDVLLVRHPDAPHGWLASQVFEKTELREGRVGNAMTVVPVNAPDVLETAKAAANALNVVGPCDIDLRRDRHGVAKVLEINARIGAHTLKAPAVFDALVALFRQGHLGG